MYELRSIAAHHVGVYQNQHLVVDILNLAEYLNFYLSWSCPNMAISHGRTTLRDSAWLAGNRTFV